MKVFESELRGKTVMSNDGAYLGILRNISANIETGDLTMIHVEPGEEVDAGAYAQDAQGRITFPFQNIKSVRDVIMVMP
ncbi:MAG: PRC-barrel domain-containing protein [Thermoplasmatota archaeon]|jgi:sporulation protein YlmC with PRC-barrel domain